MKKQILTVATIALLGVLYSTAHASWWDTAWRWNNNENMTAQCWGCDEDWHHVLQWYSILECGGTVKHYGNNVDGDWWGDGEHFSVGKRELSDHGCLPHWFWYRCDCCETQYPWCSAGSFSALCDFG